MPVIAMSIPCVVTERLGSDVYGAPIFGRSVRALCAIVKLVKKSQHTTVRADSGATRGHANEAVADAVLLMHKRIEPGIDSEVSIRGMKLRIISVRHRTDAMGRIDHYEVGCSIE